jgi:hypothetical protein
MAAGRRGPSRHLASCAGREPVVASFLHSGIQTGKWAENESRKVSASVSMLSVLQSRMIILP